MKLHQLGEEAKCFGHDVRGSDNKITKVYVPGCDCGQKPFASQTPTEKSERCHDGKHLMPHRGCILR